MKFTFGHIFKENVLLEDHCVLHLIIFFIYSFKLSLSTKMCIAGIMRSVSDSKYADACGRCRN